MEEEIELRPYIELLVRRWYWIVGAAVLAGAVAFGVSSLRPPTFEATALVAITQPGQLVQFDPRIRTIEEDSQPLKAYPELAMSDGVLTSLLEALNPNLEGVDSVQQLRGIVDAESGTDPSLIRLVAQHEEPGVAAEIANAWAAIFVARADAVFGSKDGEQLDYFEAQLETAEDNLAAAEAALVEFQSRNRSALIDGELGALQEAQAEYLADQQSIDLISQNIQGLRSQLSARSGESTLTLADQLTALTLQLKAFNAAFKADSALPLQLQIDGGGSFENATRSVQISYLDDLMAALEERKSQTSEALAQLEPQILALQQERQELEAEVSRLARDRTVAEETYLSLARKVDEERISSQEISGGVRLASEAAVPQRPAGSRKVFGAVAAALVMTTVVAAGLVAVEWWQKGSAV